MSISYCSSAVLAAVLPQPMSRCSTTATSSPSPAIACAINAAVMPPPTIATSQRWSASSRGNGFIKPFFTAQYG